MMPLSVEEVIMIIKGHKEHWQRLLREKICDETEGRETIEAFDRAISALKEEKKVGKKEPDSSSWDNVTGDPFAGEGW